MKKVILAAMITSSLLLAGCGCKYTHALINTGEAVIDIPVDQVSFNNRSVTIRAINGDTFKTGYNNVVLTDARD